MAIPWPSAPAVHFQPVNGWYDQSQEGPNTWSDEMSIAATALLEATGDPQYRDYILPELPSDLTAMKQWGYRTGGPWPIASLLLARSTSPLIDADLKDRATAAIIDWAQATQGLGGKAYAKPFGMALPRLVNQRR